MCFDALSQAASWVGDTASSAWNGITDAVGSAFGSVDNLGNLDALSGINNTIGNSIAQGTGEAAAGAGAAGGAFSGLPSNFSLDPILVAANTTAPVTSAVGGTAGPAFGGLENILSPSDYDLGGVAKSATEGTFGNVGANLPWEAAPASGWDSIWNGIKSGGDFLKGNSWLAPLAGLALSATKPTSLNAVPGFSQLTNNAATMGNVGNQLLQPLLTGGPLPAGAENPIDRSVAANEAKIRQQYASLGLSGSTMEAQALAGAKADGAAQKSQMATNLAQAGLSALGSSSGLYGNIVNAEVTNDKSLQDAITKMAVALAGGNQLRPATAGTV